MVAEPSLAVPPEAVAAIAAGEAFAPLFVPMAVPVVDMFVFMMHVVFPLYRHHQNIS